MYEIKAQVDSEVEVKLYGTISQWEKVNAADFSNAIDSALKLNPKKIVFPTHSPGGDVGEGVAMTSVLAKVKARGIKTLCRIDGMAASMMAVFASACDETEITPFARMMVHEGRAGAYGTSTQLRERADLVDSYNKDMAAIHAAKTKKEQQWVLDNWMSNGKDTWFTADEAIKANLADRKVPSVVEKLPNLAASTGWMEMAAHYDPYFKNENTMNRDELIALLGLAATATDAEIKAAMALNKTKADAADAKGTPPPATPPAGAQADTTAADKASVIEGVVSIGKERGMDDKQLASLKVLAGVDIKAAMDMIPASTGASNQTASITDLIQSLKNSGGEGLKTDRKAWTYADWEKNDSKGLLAMAKEKPAEFGKLFAASNDGYVPTAQEIAQLI